MAATQHLTEVVDGVLRLQDTNLLHQSILWARDRVDEVHIPNHLCVDVATGFHSVPVGVDQGYDVLAGRQW